MWRSNVLRVRNCSSSAAWRNTRRYSSRSLAVTTEEFEKALDGIIGPEKASRDGTSRGFAISGGVDSMALASLFARSRNLLSSSNTQLAHAFIVDHKVRPESTEEAEWVAEQCRAKFGMQASVLPLTWPANFDPLDHKRFETDARTLRYQAFGRACRAAGINELMVAHHADDQAETVLMRLANNRLRSGLQAMQPIEWIPECHGIHGVSHSGSGRDSIRNMSSPFEDGGVRILRPLLSFDKSRLIATCEQHGVAWVEDKTNHLQTYTSRNAIRHILKNHKLPAALSIKSLVGISSEMQERVSWHKSQAQQLLDRSPKRLNLQVGSLIIQYPRFQELLSVQNESTAFVMPPPGSSQAELLRSVEKPVETWTSSEWNRARNTAICLLAQAGQLVSPRETPPLGELASTVANIWPEFREFEERGPSHAGFAGNRSSYCVHGIWWRKCDSSSFDTSPKSAQPEWLLTRQPLESHGSHATSRSIRYPPSHMFPLTQVLPGVPSSREKPDWQLFDGRWWISVKNFTADALIVRHFTKADLDRMSPLHIARRGGPEQYIAVALSMLKPADVRFTLPALFQCDMASKKETLVGFPTLNVSMDKLGVPKSICSWRVRYKKLSNEISAAHASGYQGGYDFDPGVTHAMIRNELAKFDKTLKKKPVRTDRKPDPNSDHMTQVQSRPTSKTQSLDRSDFSKKTDEVYIKRVSTDSGKETVRKQGTVPLVPTAESERRGRSEKRDGGGYDIKWEDFSNRFN